ncbi:MAG: hypothetical protein VX378_14755 [Pseudomonadota bacterium]|nr:hypothetical protein [Pseudomonadota bacterium]MEE3072355.1 hypothetical protein [Pseudomonadota bacterium]
MEFLKDDKALVFDRKHAARPWGLRQSEQKLFQNAKTSGLLFCEQFTLEGLGCALIQS